MAREMKMGIAVIGVLLIVFCGLLAKRLTRPSKLPLTSISSKNPTNLESPTVKAVAPPVRPTLVTSKSDNIQAQDRYWAASTNPQGISDANKATQPGLLAAALPIQDLDAKQPSGSAVVVPHQTGYVGSTDAQNGSGNSVTSDPPQYNDPFQYKPTPNKQTNTTAERAQDTRYPDNRASNTASPTSTDPYPNYQSATPPPTPSPTNHELTRPTTPASPPYRYSPGSIDGNSTSRTNQPAAADVPYGTGQGATSYSPTADSQWSMATMTSNTIPTKPIERDGEKYSVQPNDTFWTICERAYGTGAFFKALYEYNRRRHKQADELVVGQALLVPDENVLRRHYPDLCPRPRKTVASTEQRLISASTRLRSNGRVYKAVDGDTLYDIAKFELGKASRWAEVYELNRDVLGDDFDYLRPGTELILPVDSPRGDSVTQQPERTVPLNSGRY